MCAQGCAVTASRLAFAYSRDGVLPFSRYMAVMNRRTFTPVYAVLFNQVVQTAALCLIFAGGVAIGAVFSIVSGLMICCSKT
jgi:amino acid transporter